MTALTNFAETQLLTWFFTAGATTRPTQWFVQVHTGDPGEDGTGGLTGLAGQGRAAATFAVAGSVASNTGAVDVAMTVTPGQNLTHVSIWSAATAGNPLAYGPLDQPRSVTSGDTLQIAAGALTVTLD
jgi:hypothetical protein